MSSRFWLSCCAFLLGVLSMMVLIGLDYRSPVEFAQLSLPALVSYLALIVGPVVYWLYIFYRRRGTKVILRSRPQLSISAFLFGEMLMLCLVSFGVAVPLDFQNFTTVQFLSLVSLFSLLLSFWLLLFYRPRGAQHLWRLDEKHAG